MKRILFFILFLLLFPWIVQGQTKYAPSMTNPGAIGGTTPGTGNFTSLTATSIPTPGPIGLTTPGIGNFTSLAISPTFGSELVDTAATWSHGTTWTHGSGTTLVKAAASGTTAATYETTEAAGTFVKVVTTVSGTWGAYNLTLAIGGVAVRTITADGVYTDYVRETAGTDLTLTPSNTGLIISALTVSVKAITTVASLDNVGGLVTTSIVSPGPIGGTTPAAGTFTTMTAGTAVKSTAVNITAGATGTSVSVGHVNRQVYVRTYAAADFTDSDTTKGIVICTLPAKTKIVGFYADITETFKGGTVDAATLEVGITAEGAAEIMATKDIWTAVATYGLADADMGTGMTRAAAIQGGYLPSWSGTTAIYATIDTTTGNLNALTTGSVTFYIETERF